MSVFVVLAPSNFQNPPKIAELLKSPPDALNSQFRATYTSLLNLLDAFGSFAQVREIAEKSFAFRETAAQITKLEKLIEKREAEIQKKLDGSEFRLTIDSAKAFERLTNSRLRLQSNLPNTRAEVRIGWLRENVREGRIVTKSRNSKRLFLTLNVFGDKISAMRDDGEGATLSLPHVGRVLKKFIKSKKNRSMPRLTTLTQDAIPRSKNRNFPRKAPMRTRQSRF